MPDETEPVGASPFDGLLAGQGSGAALSATMSAIGGKWKAIIIYWLAGEPIHLAALQRRMPGISRKVLTQQLRELQADAIVSRREARRIPEPVMYSLTAYGRSLVPVIEGMRQWGRAHLEREAQAREERGLEGRERPA